MTGKEKKRKEKKKEEKEKKVGEGRDVMRQNGP